MYKLLKNPFGKTLPTIHRIIDNAFIPFDLANTDYQEYLKWLEEGNTPLPAEEPTADEISE
jgi:antitoxin component of RelBE/YafQ-DinJ toxin-antitoxin module